MREYTNCDIAAVIHMYYISKYCEDMFSFDNGETHTKVSSYYKRIEKEFGTDAIEEIKSKIKVRKDRGSDYAYYEFSHEDFPKLIYQVTAMFDFKRRPVDGYNGHSKWADVGLFMYDRCNYEFEELNEL